MPIIEVQNLSKKYRVGQIGAGSFAQSFRSWWSKSPQDHSSHPETFWALKDVNFQVKEGEILGIIGKNGAGKSTLLKILSRITEPTSGRVRLKGRVASLLEVGTGFHEDLTGRENIYLNGTILGLRKREIDARLDEIIDFSGVEKFIDTPVKRYSSGMRVRLAFAVAAHLEPEILIIDEVLAVGDADFQKKCLGKMQDVAQHGRTIIFVSHQMSAVRSLCNTGLLLSRGELVDYGKIERITNQYLNIDSTALGNKWIREASTPNGSSVIQSASIELEGNQPTIEIKGKLRYENLNGTKPLMFAADISDSLGTVIMQAQPHDHGFLPANQGKHEFQFSIQLPPLVPGVYTIDFWIGTHYTETVDFIKNAVRFEIIDSPVQGRSFLHTYDHGSIVPPSYVTNISSIR